MKIGDKVTTNYAGIARTGTITGKHGSADYYAVKLDSGMVIYRWAADMEPYDDNKPTYNNGSDFWRDLLIRFGRVEAVKIANDYLDLPLDRSDKGEYDFRKELFSAMFA